MNDFVTFMQQNWGWIISFLGVVAPLFVYLWKRMKALERGVQVFLLSQIISYWSHYSEKGFAPIYSKENFENCWKQYEALGKNGVMSGIHKEFMELPDKQKGEIEK